MIHARTDARTDAPTSAYDALTAFAVAWPILDAVMTFAALLSGVASEGNPWFASLFHLRVGMLAGLLMHAGLAFFALALSFTRYSDDRAIRRVGWLFLIAWAALGVAVLGHNSITLLLAWLG